MFQRLRRWLGNDEPRHRESPGYTGEVQPDRATYREIILIRRAVATPPRLARSRRREITKRIRTLEEADVRRRVHLAAGREPASSRKISARRLSARQVRLLDALILIFDATFYYTTISQILIGTTGILKSITAVLWALPAPLIIIIAARHLGAELRDRQDERDRRNPADEEQPDHLGSRTERGSPGERDRRDDTGVRRARSRSVTLSALALCLIAFITLLLAVMAAGRFTGSMEADGGLDPMMMVTAVAFGLIFVAAPAFAVAVHAMHDPAHRADLLRYEKRARTLAGAHEHAWGALLRLANQMMTEIGYVHHAVDEHIARGRDGIQAMGAHPPARVQRAERPASLVSAQFPDLWDLVGEVPEPLVDSERLTYNWTAFYEILTTLDRYPPPAREDGSGRTLPHVQPTPAVLERRPDGRATTPPDLAEQPLPSAPPPSPNGTREHEPAKDDVPPTEPPK